MVHVDSLSKSWGSLEDKRLLDVTQVSSYVDHFIHFIRSEQISDFMFTLQLHRKGRKATSDGRQFKA